MKDFEAFAREAGKGIKTEGYLNVIGRMMTKVKVETTLNDELDDHLGYSKHEQAGAGNSRNGHWNVPALWQLGLLLKEFVGIPSANLHPVFSHDNDGAAWKRTFAPEFRVVQ